MINEILKQEFIYNYESFNANIKDRMTPVFKNVERYENMFGKDCSAFTVAEIIEFYKGLCSSSLEYIETINSLLSSYATYAISNGNSVDGQNHYLEINIDTMNACVNKGFVSSRIITRQELLNEIEGWINNSDKFLVLALFEGICGNKYNELSVLRPSDFRNGVAYLPDRTLSVSDILVRYAQLSAHEEVLHPVKGSGNDRRYKSGDDRIIKASWNAVREENDNILRRRVISRLKRIKDAMGQDGDKYSSVALTESGRINQIINGMIESKYNTPQEFFADKALVSELEYRYGTVHAPNSRYLLVYGSIIRDMFRDAKN